MKRGAFETGTYRNVFAEAGYDKETIEKRKNEIFHTLFYGAESERIYHPVGDDMAYIEDTGNHDARTEGMSYGMMMCVQMDRKEEFDRLWKWAKTYMYLEEGEMQDILHGRCSRMEQKILLAQHRMVRNFLRWHCFSQRTAGETAKGYSITAGKRRSCCTPASTREKTERVAEPCGMPQII